MSAPVGIFTSLVGQLCWSSELQKVRRSHRAHDNYSFGAKAMEEMQIDQNFFPPLPFLFCSGPLINHNLGFNTHSPLVD
jgi:hypothetical protein